LNIIENTGLTGYGDAIWPRHRHDNGGSGVLGATTSVPMPSPTPQASPCVGNVNANGMEDVADIQTTAARPGCVQYLPAVVANWDPLWPTATPTPTPGVTIRANLTRLGSHLPALLKPKANLRPMWGDCNQSAFTPTSASQHSPSRGPRRPPEDTQNAQPSCRAS